MRSVIAAYLGTDHTEQYFAAKNAGELLPQLGKIYDEPFADSSQLPTILVSKLAREQVTVALTGDGGDEMLGGYERYFVGMDLFAKRDLVPASMRPMLATLMKSVSVSNWSRVLRFAPRRIRPNSLGAAIHWYADVLSPDGQSDIYKHMVSIWSDPRQILQASGEHAGSFWQDNPSEVSNDSFDFMQYIDTLTYLPDDILTKVDRASMSVGLEARSPLLDHHLHEFAWRLPRNFKTTGRTGKLILRKVLDRYVPRELTDRPKQGFGVPVGKWLREDLRDWAETMFAREKPRKVRVFGFRGDRDILATAPQRVVRLGRSVVECFDVSVLVGRLDVWRCRASVNR